MGRHEENLKNLELFTGRNFTDEAMARARDLDEFPLLREMVELARSGETYLPPTPNHMGVRVELRELGWTKEHRCFIGGPQFMVIRIPEGQHVTVVPRPPKPPTIESGSSLPTASNFLKTDIYYEQTYGVAYQGRKRLAMRLMVHPSYKIPPVHSV